MRPSEVGRGRWPRHVGDVGLGGMSCKASALAAGGRSRRGASERTASRTARRAAESACPGAGTRSHRPWHCRAYAVHGSVRSSSADAPACRRRGTSSSRKPEPDDLRHENGNVSRDRLHNGSRSFTFRAKIFSDGLKALVRGGGFVLAAPKLRDPRIGNAWNGVRYLLPFALARRKPSDYFRD